MHFSDITFTVITIIIEIITFTYKSEYVRRGRDISGGTRVINCLYYLSLIFTCSGSIPKVGSIDVV